MSIQNRKIKRVLDPRKIRIGHKVRILIPKVFERVGYDATYAKAKEEFLKESSLDGDNGFNLIIKDPQIQNMIENFITEFTEYQYAKENNNNSKWTICRKHDALKNNIVTTVAHNLAFEAVGKRMAAGDQKRKKYEEEIEELNDMTFTVEDKKAIVTGTRFAPSGGYDEWNGDYDYEPGGLAGAKRHTILSGVPSLKSNKIDASYVERVIETHMVESPGWLKRYYTLLSIKQKMDILNMFINKSVPLSVKTVRTINKYMRDDLLKLIKVSEYKVRTRQCIKTLLGFGPADINWVLNNPGLFEDIGYDWLGHKDRATIELKLDEEKRVLNKSF